MMHKVDLLPILESLLFSSADPLPLSRMQAAFAEWEKPDEADMMDALLALEAQYAKHPTLEFKKLATGYCLQTKPYFSPWISRLLAEKPVKYSRALLEMLAIIAYRQPVSRADIEHIRGVAVNTVGLKMLMERDWVRISGYRDVPGKPAVYSTTKAFLDYFNLASLNDLPALHEEDMTDRGKKAPGEEAAQWLEETSNQVTERETNVSSDYA